MMLNGTLYLSGAIACMVWRWMDWISKQPPGKAMMGFWRDRLPTNISALLVTLMLMGLYLSGALGAATKEFIPESWMSADIPGWAVAPPAGFAITFAARAIVKKFAGKVGEEGE